MAETLLAHHPVSSGVLVSFVGSYPTQTRGENADHLIFPEAGAVGLCVCVRARTCAWVCVRVCVHSRARVARVCTHVVHRLAWMCAQLYVHVGTVLRLACACMWCVCILHAWRAHTRGILCVLVQHVFSTYVCTHVYGTHILACRCVVRACMSVQYLCMPASLC